MTAAISARRKANSPRMSCPRRRESSHLEAPYTRPSFRTPATKASNRLTGKKVESGAKQAPSEADSGYLYHLGKCQNARKKSGADTLSAPLHYLHMSKTGHFLVPGIRLATTTDHAQTTKSQKAQRDRLWHKFDRTTKGFAIGSRCSTIVPAGIAKGLRLIVRHD